MILTGLGPLLGLILALTLALSGPLLARYLPRRIDDVDAAIMAGTPLPARAQSWHAARAELRLASAEALVLMAAPFLVLAGLAATGPLTAAALAIQFFASVMVLLIVIDARTQLLPDALTGPLALLGAGLAFAVAGLEGSGRSLLAGFLAYGLLRLVSWIFEKRRGEEGMGQGDVKLIAMLAIWFGLMASFGVLFLGSLLAIVQKGMAWALRRSAWREEFAFGPALGATALLLLSAYTVPAGCKVLAGVDPLSPAMSAFCAR